MANQMTQWLQNYAENIEENIEEKVYIRVGEFQGEQYLGDGEYAIIKGSLFITTHQGNLFKVVDEQGQAHTFDVLDDKDIITIDEEYFVYVMNEDHKISLNQIKSDIDTLHRDFERFGGAWEFEDGGYGCISIAENELRLCKGIAKRYPFKYKYNPNEFNKNPNDLSEDWSDIKFDLTDFDKINVTDSNYDKVDAVAFDFQQELIAMLEQLLHELEFLPPRLREEFLEVLCYTDQDAHSIRKNCEYFLDDIMGDLSEEEKNKMFVVVK